MNQNFAYTYFNSSDMVLRCLIGTYKSQPVLNVRNTIDII